MFVLRLVHLADLITISHIQAFGGHLDKFRDFRDDGKDDALDCLAGLDR